VAAAVVTPRIAIATPVVQMHPQTAAGRCGVVAMQRTAVPSLRCHALAPRSLHTRSAAAKDAPSSPSDPLHPERLRAAEALKAVEKFERQQAKDAATKARIQEEADAARRAAADAKKGSFARGARTTFRWLGRGLGALLVGSVVYGVFSLRHEEEKSWQLMLWKTLPLRFLSHVWGSVHRLELPRFARKPLYIWWTRTFHCNLDEMEGGPAVLEDFPNLNSFFIRRIDLARCRPLDDAEMVSPVDGRVNCYGEVEAGGRVDQIKGMSYKVEDLLGHALPNNSEGATSSLTTAATKGGKADAGAGAAGAGVAGNGGKMYYYVLYLAPGDYHRMHSPADCVIEERRHFPGALYPVAPYIARYIPSLFVRNERVTLSGHWAHGFFAMVPVGAYNVGSMKLTFDEELDTNLRAHTVTAYRPDLEDGLQAKPFFRSYRKETRPALGGGQGQGQGVGQLQQDVLRATDAFAKTDPAIDAGTAVVAKASSGKAATNVVSPAASLPALFPVPRVSASGIHLAKGSEFARFELGSTIVVVFQLERGKRFVFNVEPEQKVKLGQRIGVVVDEAEWRRQQQRPPVDNGVVVV